MMKFTPKGLSVRAHSRSSWLESEAGVNPGWAIPSIPRPPASDTAAANSGGETAPIPACWIGIVQPTNSVNLVVIMLYVSLNAPLMLLADVRQLSHETPHRATSKVRS